jgi:hypothetical protein
MVPKHGWFDFQNLSGFFRPDCNFNANSERLFCQEERFYLVFFFFSYLLIAFALIAIDIASNRWRGLRAATRSADLLIETVIFSDRIAMYC